MNIQSKTLLWLDDKRNPFENEAWLNFSPIEKPFSVVWVKSYYQFVDWIEKNGLTNAICFDHDLSDIKKEQQKLKEKTGYDCAKWLVNYCMDNNLDLPKWNVQSSNVPGKENINGILLSYLKHIKK